MKIFPALVKNPKTILFSSFFYYFYIKDSDYEKNILFLSIFLFGIFSLQAQTADTLENPGFENWEVPFGIPTDHPEPVNWSSIKTDDNASVNALAPVNWARCDTAHTGKYSLKLFNVAALGLVATGIMSNGR